MFVIVLAVGPGCSPPEPSADGITPEGGIAEEGPERPARREVVPEPIEEAVAPRVGGACDYDTVAGTGEVLSIGDVPEGARVCEGGSVQLMVRFRPHEGDENVRELPFLLRGEFHPPASCVDALGLKAGDTFEMTMDVITKGTCTPWVPTMPAAWTERCDADCVRP